MKEVSPLIERAAFDFDQRGLVGEDKAITKDDLIQVGWEAALIALESFDETKPASFGTYAYPQIWRRMIAEVHKFGDPVPIPEYLHWYVLRKVSDTWGKLAQKNKEEPTLYDLLEDEELIAYLENNRDTRGSDPETLISNALAYMSNQPVFLDDDDEDIEEWLENTEEESVETQVDNSMLQSVVQDMLEILSDDEYDIISMRFGFLGETYTLKEIGEELKCSAVTVLKTERRALDKLRRHPKTRAILRNWA
jgi:RNA polymerase sigma factor (sigma-70 family)